MWRVKKDGGGFKEEESKEEIDGGGVGNETDDRTVCVVCEEMT